MVTLKGMAEIPWNILEDSLREMIDAPDEKFFLDGIG
jgi:hypothetical protein